MHRPVLTLAALQTDGPMLRLADLAQLTSLSKETLRQDIKSGHLKATTRQKGRCTLYLISRVEARRYVAAMFHAEQIA